MRTASASAPAGERLSCWSRARRGRSKNTSGLYHVALHVPARKELARITARLMATRFPNSPTDHLVSEATYLWDLDGNGIEITFETPWRGTFKSNGDDFYALTTDCRRHSGRDAIDLHGLMAELDPADDLRQAMPAGTRVGHVHLHVGDLDAAMGFYNAGIGFERLMLNRRVRMGDVGLGYQPHAIAFNTWAGTGAPQAPAGASGLRWFGIEVPGVDDLAAIRDRLADGGAEVGERDGGYDTRDPAGNRVRLTSAA